MSVYIVVSTSKPSNEENTALESAEMLPTTGENVKHLYLIAGLSNRNIIKIGIADNPTRRLEALQTANPDTLMFVMCQLIKDARKVERALHELLEPYRVRGEWFDPPTDKLYAIRDILWALDLDCECIACSCESNRRILNRLPARNQKAP